MYTFRSALPGLRDLLAKTTLARIEACRFQEFFDPDRAVVIGPDFIYLGVRFFPFLLDNVSDTLFFSD